MHASTSERICRSILIVVAALIATAGIGLAEPAAHRPDPALQERVSAVLPKQGHMLQQALGTIEAQRPGVRDLYFIGFAGYGDQDVFRKEVERVRELFDGEFGTRGRSIILVNSPTTLEQYPLATLANLQTALAAIGKKLDPGEDILFLFMTSHGDRRGFTIRLNGRVLGDIRPKQLAAALAAAGIRNRVVLISSCFSGQFVGALANDNSLIMTAAAANRTSFGCSTEAEWTYFGRGYFVDALPRDRNFVQAFYDARRSVT